MSAARKRSFPPPLRIRAMIDTGAAVSVLKEGLSARLGLRVVDAVRIRTASTSLLSCRRYRVRVTFPNRTVFETRVVEAPLPGFDVDCLIGRDILSRGVLVYLGFGDQFCVSF